MRKSRIGLLLIAFSAVMMLLTLTACTDNESDSPSGNNTLSEESGNYQFDDSVTIPSGGERVRDSDGWQSFEDGSGDGFSVTVEDDDNDIIIMGEQSFEVDVTGDNEHRFSHSAGAD
ncbi:MAG: hypothetical protein LBC82_04710 [Oscillospiraceae bacterium]|jgi:hypothetical protein|nr:hypothetical protein [Oscillospiraceae bacterium]